MATCTCTQYVIFLWGGANPFSWLTLITVVGSRNLWLTILHCKVSMHLTFSDPRAGGPPVLRGCAVPPGVPLAAHAPQRPLPRPHPCRHREAQALPRKGMMNQSHNLHIFLNTSNYGDKSRWTTLEVWTFILLCLQGCRSGIPSPNPGAKGPSGDAKYAEESGEFVHATWVSD